MQLIEWASLCKGSFCSPSILSLVFFFSNPLFISLETSVHRINRNMNNILINWKNFLIGSEIDFKSDECHSRKGCSARHFNTKCYNLPHNLYMLKLMFKLMFKSLACVEANQGKRQVCCFCSFSWLKIKQLYICLCYYITNSWFQHLEFHKICIISFSHDNSPLLSTALEWGLVYRVCPNLK